MTVWVDGELRGGDAVPRGDGFAPFETMGARGAEVPLWARHLERLGASAARLGIGFDAAPALRAAAAEVLLKNGHADHVLRLSLVPEGPRAQVVLSSRRRSPIRVVKLLPTILERPDGAPPAVFTAARRPGRVVPEEAARTTQLCFQHSCVFNTAASRLCRCSAAATSHSRAAT